ncbi:MAG: tRNA (N(6)-L-threonylcarbamoyladenosine(37)-C(2))-methylthiotransferase MtaB [Flavobacteriales bacterium]|nr:tRNA (N(6)-L-threonylcarbamoyladenosine(37)-C(2))-methylthiotransferase MtaB [Flavobacteriales bacterium]
MKKVAFYTLGCKLNFSESSSIARDFEKQGYTRVAFEEAADVYVINTCSVTDNADRKCKAIVKKALKTSPEAFVAVIGCYAQLRPEEITRIPGVNIVLGASEKFNLPYHVEQHKQGKVQAVHSCEILQVKEFNPAYSAGDRTRSFLKVQDGCDYFCAFCTIPMARGRSRSGSIEDVVSSAHEIAATGVKEVVLTGVNIGDFGRGSDETFLDLITQLDQVKGIERFRISSIEPNLLDEDIIRFVADSRRFVPHFHIPLQSGSDEILKAMRRKYQTALYRNRIEMIKSVMPMACIGVDVIVGFPGETEAHYLETEQFLESLDISYLHVFTYSERPGTTALRLDGTVSKEDREIRSRRLHKLSDLKRKQFYENYLGSNQKVLWESDEKEGMMFGFTDNYIKTTMPADPSRFNQIEEVTLSGLSTASPVLTAEAYLPVTA